MARKIRKDYSNVENAYVYSYETKAQERTEPMEATAIETSIVNDTIINLQKDIDYLAPEDQLRVFHFLSKAIGNRKYGLRRSLNELMGITKVPDKPREQDTPINLDTVRAFLSGIEKDCNELQHHLVATKKAHDLQDMYSRMFTAEANAKKVYEKIGAMYELLSTISRIADVMARVDR